MQIKCKSKLFSLIFVILCTNYFIFLFSLLHITTDCDLPWLFNRRNIQDNLKCYFFDKTFRGKFLILIVNKYISYICYSSAHFILSYFLLFSGSKKCYKTNWMYRLFCTGSSFKLQ